MPEAVHLRDLLVDPGMHPRGQAHLSAASGLVCTGPWLYLVADDEHHLGVLRADDATQPVRLHRIVPGDLPRDKGQRKKQKPDLEALALLPRAEPWPHGALLALGSGSRPARQRAFLLKLDEAGVAGSGADVIDLAALYQPLRADFPDLNIEGAFAAGGRFHLLQRGNKGDARNACISYPLPDLQEWVAGKRDAPPAAAGIQPFALGHIDGVPLGFTDGAALPGGGWVFSAVAEDTGNSFEDGACAGSVIGWVGAGGALQRIERIGGSPKVEGISLDGNGRLLLVTDADDPAIASRLLAWIGVFG